jgi:hypothetical protein
VDLAGKDVAGVAGQTDSAPIQVLIGLGGVGKTQLAVQHARLRWEASGGRDLDLLVWTNAQSRLAIVSSYAEAFRKVSGEDVDDPDQAAGRMLAWLAETSRPWLMVLDGLTNVGDLTGLWPPVAAFGQTLVTTRRRDEALRGQDRRLINVDVFSRPEAAAFLVQRLKHYAASLDQHERLAEDLGYLPLALAQAATYIADRQLTCKRYRQLLADRRTRVADLLPELHALPDDHTTTVTATWSLSIELANQLAPTGLAGPMLALTALLAPNGIPTAVLTAPSSLTYLETHRTTGDGPVSADTARDALTCLHRLSLASVAFDQQAASVRVHALVQRVTRDQLSTDRLAIAACAAADALLHAWPETDPDGVITQVLHTNTAALQAVTQDALWAVRYPHRGWWKRLVARLFRLPRHGVHQLLVHAGTSLGETGQAAAACSYYRDLYSTAEQQLGPDHPQTLFIRHELAYWQGEAGDVAGAAADLEQLLTDDVRVLGANHPATLNTRHTIARFLGTMGDPAEAIIVLEQLLTDRLRVLGPDHPDTLITRGNLGRLQGEAGDPVGAVAAIDQLLADHLRLLGPDHPDTLITRGNLAHWRGEAGDPAGAAIALEQLLTDRLRVLGPDHPDTLITRDGLAYWRRSNGERSD